MMEIKYIDKYNSSDNNFGYNKKSGGSNGRQTRETIEKIRNALKGKYTGKKHHMFGKHHLYETKIKISKSKKGKYIQEDSHSFGKTGLLNGKSVQVKCITTNKVFESANLASEYYKCDRSSIIKCCRNKRKTAGKSEKGVPLLWEYYNN